MAETGTNSSNKYNELCKFLEKDTVGTEVAIYGTAGVMLLLAFIKRRPTYLVRQMKKPSHIPNKLIYDRVVQTGTIRGVEQKNMDTLILVSHRPKFFSIFSNPNKVLPMKLPGVKINGNGYSWIQTCLIGKEATFIPLVKDKNNEFVISQMCLVHPTKDQRLLDISDILIKLQFAKFVRDDAITSSATQKYYKHLKKVEDHVLSKELWMTRLSKIQWLWNKFNELKAYVLPKHKLLPELVR